MVKENDFPEYRWPPAADENSSREESDFVEEEPFAFLLNREKIGSPDANPAPEAAPIAQDQHPAEAIVGEGSPVVTNMGFDKSVKFRLLSQGEVPALGKRPIVQAGDREINARAAKAVVDLGLPADAKVPLLDIQTKTHSNNKSIFSISIQNGKPLDHIQAIAFESVIWAKLRDAGVEPVKNERLQDQDNNGNTRIGWLIDTSKTEDAYQALNQVMRGAGLIPVVTDAQIDLAAREDVYRRAATGIPVVTDEEIALAAQEVAHRKTLQSAGPKQVRAEAISSAPVAQDPRPAQAVVGEVAQEPLKEGLNNGGPVVTNMGYDRSIKFRPPKLSADKKRYLPDFQEGDEEAIAGLFGTHPDVFNRVVQIAWNENKTRPAVMFDTGEEVQFAFHAQNGGPPKLARMTFNGDHVNPNSGSLILDAWEACGNPIDQIHPHGSPAFVKNMTQAIQREIGRRDDLLKTSITQWKTLYGADPATAEVLDAMAGVMKQNPPPNISLVTQVLRESGAMGDRNGMSTEAPDFARLATLLGVKKPDESQPANSVSGEAPVPAAERGPRLAVRTPRSTAA